VAQKPGTIQQLPNSSKSRGTMSSSCHVAWRCGQLPVSTSAWPRARETLGCLRSLEIFYTIPSCYARDLKK